MARHRGGHGGGRGGGGHGSGGGKGGRRKWDDEDEGEGIFNVGSGYGGKSKQRRGQRQAEPEPDGGPPGASSRFPGYPPARTLPQSSRDHILDGDPNDVTSGGHRHGTNRPDKTEFPKEWDDDTIVRNVEDVANHPDTAVQQPDGEWLVTGTRDGVKIQAYVGPDGVVRTGFPVSGKGVRKNPPPTP